MKKIIIGGAMFITGFIGFAILCSAAIISDFTLNGSKNFMDVWQLSNVTHIAIGYLSFGIIGFIIAILGVLQNNNGQTKKGQLMQIN